MAKLFSYYSDKVDRAWYQSSNVLYSECIDNENDLKTLRVVFSNGTQYEYKGINVNDYLVFRESASQGQALNRLIKQNNSGYEKLENANLELLNEEFQDRIDGAYFITNTHEGFKISTNTGETVFDDHMYDDDMLKTVTDILQSVGTRFKLFKKETV